MRGVVLGAVALVVLVTGGCGNGGPVGGVAKGGEFCEATEGVVRYFEDLRAGKELPSRAEIQAMVHDAGRMKELAPAGWTTAPSQRESGVLVARECGAELGRRWGAMVGAADEAIEPPPSALRPVTTALDLADGARPFEVAGYPVHVRATGLCREHDVTVRLVPADGGAPHEIESVWTDEDGVLDAHVDLPAELPEGRYVIEASAPAGVNQYDASCAAETATSPPIVVRSKASLDPARDW
jgi:hypothetical protein